MSSPGDAKDIAEQASPRTLELAGRLRAAIGAAKVLTDPAQLRTYECDGLEAFRVRPGVVVLAEHRDDVVRTVKLCAEAGIPFVARGSGTGLSGGAVPVADGVLIVLSRLRQIVDVDPDNARMVVEPGVINLWVTREAAPHDQLYAPDPSSQQVCSIGGNVAENSGGAHCLKYGFTVNHVMGAEVVLADGEVVHLGGRAPEHPGFDLLGAFVGSEGTLGVVTEVTVRLLRVPESVQTMLVGFHSVADAAGTVSDIIAAGILPAAIEMMDALAIEAAEAAVRCGYPGGAEAVLVIELDGPQVEVDEQFGHVETLARARHAFETRIAADAEDRALMWRGRKSAFAAVGRISPSYYVQDGVIPRTRLPEILAAMSTLADEANLRVANVFHAGDGNLHPLILFDDAVPGASKAAEDLGFAILDLCIEAGGSITGEHGVGLEKKSKMAGQFSPADLDTMQLVRCAFDPDGLANPGKLFPTPRLCGERPGVRTADTAPDPALGEVF
ncbi:FAD-linked oxidase C-terminal domain-containing protein [Actinophytocola sp.]|uniref:FAD-linked oxidase C-terminal domain-containing protein n=1 Tax=Actinophytocola sp. TaxID=1872138 RepID=UPI002D2D85A6|nr:FAD-linked oxidase C-terminal domain-containing protein [Actinophytocola sp.]HYQ69217.1 FAD-linked oxidase C-terminal domain-containing protein [Actinophytocola sp.]